MKRWGSGGGQFGSMYRRDLKIIIFVHSVVFPWGISAKEITRDMVKILCVDVCYMVFTKLFKNP